MPFPDAHPDYRWPTARLKYTDAEERQKERRNPYFAQSLMQSVLRDRFHFAKKTERQMKLFLGKPAQAGKMRVETKQRRLDGRR